MPGMVVSTSKSKPVFRCTACIAGSIIAATNARRLDVAHRVIAWDGPPFHGEFAASG